MNTKWVPVTAISVTCYLLFALAGINLLHQGAGATGILVLVAGIPGGMICFLIARWLQRTVSRLRKNRPGDWAVLSAGITYLAIFLGFLAFIATLIVLLAGSAMENLRF
ncbi:hypothetical protein [Taibaiella koreensis]|uniref:hypothetical protein n=1 Tax=Taibaiella koreensis TaxID=1268548 RepID=UPI000E5A09F5|nr:hypothetical protein [Taibaiella koreensis]